VAGRRRAGAAAVRVLRRLLRAQRRQQRDEPRRHRPGGRRLQRQHPPALALVYCGHEIQVNESLQIPGSDAIKTGSAYGFANLNAKQARTDECQQRGVWHEMEIRLVGQQFTVLIDGEVVNRFDNGVPRLASRNGDPPTQARQFAAGYFGLPTHGGTDRIFYSEIRVKDLDERDIPRNVHAPKVLGTGRVGQQLTCTRGSGMPPARPPMT
jgi:Domain of Unknown Function (DUF1080)